MYPMCKNCKLAEGEYVISNGRKVYFCTKWGTFCAEDDSCRHFIPKFNQFYFLSRKEIEAYEYLKKIGKPVVILSLPSKYIGTLGKLKRRDLIEYVDITVEVRDNRPYPHIYYKKFKGVKAK